MGLYINEKASATEVLKFVTDELGKADTDVHGFSLYYGGELMAKLVFDPYSTEDKRQVYSVSKTFSSTAIGILSSETELPLGKKIVDIFPDKCPENISENLSKLTLEHILTMTDGHDSCSMNRIANSDDGVKAYLEHEFTLSPGTQYVYNTGASYMLSAIVSRLTGMTMLEYLNKHLFEPLDIKNVSWPQVGGNINEGGAGLRISMDDVEKVALLYASRGTYRGKEILNKDWIRLATSNRSTGDLNREPDWRSGYGYQIWRNAEGGYRADGAFGQYFIVIPNKEITMVFFCESRNVDAQLPLCFDLAKRIFEPDDAREESEAKLKNILRTTYSPLSSETLPEPFAMSVQLEDNINEYETADIKCSGDKLTLTLKNSEGTDTMVFGNGEFIENNVEVKGLLPQLYSLVPPKRKEICRFVGSFETTENGYRIQLRFLNCAHMVYGDINIAENKMNLEFSYRVPELTPPEPMNIKSI